MSDSERTSRVVLVAVDPEVRGMSQVADTLEATPLLPTQRSLKRQLALAKTGADPGAQIAVVLPATRPELVGLATLFEADRVALYFPENHPESPRLRATFSVADLTITPSPRAAAQAVALGADPDRTLVLGPEVLDHLFGEPPRRTLLAGLTEVLVSLGLDWAEKSGLVRAAELLSPYKGVNVVNYHRVLPLNEAARYHRPQMAISSPIFEAQLSTFASRRGFTPVDKLRDPAAKDRVAITFDDGYEDNFRIAWPILTQFSVPACIFVVTSLIGHPEALWWDRVGLSLFAYWRGGALAPLPAALPERAWALKDTRSVGAARTIITNALSDLNQVSDAERQAAVTAAETLIPKTENVRTMLTWDEIQVLAKSGICFGSHTRNHQPLDELPPEVAREEVLGSQADLEAQAGPFPLRITALPRGRLGALNEAEIRSAGFGAIMTTEAGVHPPNDPSLFVKRRDGRMLTLGGRHHPAKLRLELTGLLDPLRAWRYRRKGIAD